MEIDLCPCRDGCHPSFPIAFPKVPVGLATREITANRRTDCFSFFLLCHHVTNAAFAKTIVPIAQIPSILDCVSSVSRLQNHAPRVFIKGAQQVVNLVGFAGNRTDDKRGAVEIGTTPWRPPSFAIMKD